jgi:hypothetical protein
MGQAPSSPAAPAPAPVVANSREDRNKLFKRTSPNEVWCGRNSPCAPTNGGMDCTNATLGYQVLRGCPAGYDSTLEKGSCGLPMDRQNHCLKKSITDPFFNPLETSYNAVGADRNKTMLENIKNCCNKKEDADICGNLYGGNMSNPKEPLCSASLAPGCLDNIENMMTEKCINWCAANPDQCDKDEIKKMCQATSIDPSDATYWPVCGCYYKESFYAAIRKTLTDEYGIPGEFLSGGKSCYFPGCAGNRLDSDNKDKITECKAINLSTCIQNVKISGDGLKLEAGAVTQDTQCKNTVDEIKKNYGISCKTNDDCRSGSVCNPAKKCVDSTGKVDKGPGPAPAPEEKKVNGSVCVNQGDCDSGICTEKKCVAKPPADEPKSNLPLIIGLSVGGLVLLLIIAGVLFKMKSSNSSSTTTSTVSS